MFNSETPIEEASRRCTTLFVRLPDHAVRQDDVEFVNQHDIEYAYVVFDEHYESSRNTVHGYCREQGVLSTGRYGSWVYNSMEDCILLGMEAAAWART